MLSSKYLLFFWCWHTFSDIEFGCATCFGQWSVSKWGTRIFPWNVFVPWDSLSFHSAVVRKERAMGTPLFHIATEVHGVILEMTCILLESSWGLGQQIHRKWVGISNFFEKPLYFEMAYNTALLWTKWVCSPQISCVEAPPPNGIVFGGGLALDEVVRVGQGRWACLAGVGRNVFQKQNQGRLILSRPLLRSCPLTGELPLFPPATQAAL